jgi:phosphoribosyl-ATP pyrophosphohydrolase/phosphoribosyl-AMP cyclohydrolase
MVYSYSIIRQNLKNIIRRHVMGNKIIDEIKWNKEGLVPAIAQDYKTKEVLMMAFMNKEALDLTLETGLMHYYSRSREKLWKKGETSGHIQKVMEVKIDCDNDCLVFLIEQSTAACHTGHYSCFYRNIENDKLSTKTEKIFDEKAVYNKKEAIFDELYNVIKDRKENPKEGSYTNYLFDKGIDKILKKVGEENAEVIIAAKNSSKDEVKYEAADLLYHLMVLLVEMDMSMDDICDELQKRR